MSEERENSTPVENGSEPAPEVQEAGNDASAETQAQKGLLSDFDPAKAPQPTNLGVAVIAVLYILFILGISIALIALAIFLFGKFRGWIAG